MNTKAQYKEAYRVARILATMYPTIKEQLEFIKGFKWNFSGDIYIQARTSLVIR